MPDPSSPLYILLADDHTLFRDALQTYILKSEPRAQVVAVQDLHAARDHLSARFFDLVLLDWQMPGVTRLEDLTELVAAYKDSRFALMSGVVEHQDARRILNSGFWGYFPKTLSGRTMLEGIKKILAGEKFIPKIPGTDTLQPSYVADPMFYEPPRVSACVVPGVSDLTPREHDVLERLVRGMTNAEISEDLGIKLVTVKLHLRNACEKLGARNRTDAAMKCRSARLFE